MKSPPQVLTIAGSDSGGGAGIQADIQAISQNGAFAVSAITAITAQNTRGVTDMYELPLSIITAQIKAVLDDFKISAVKTGMLSSKRVVQRVSSLLKSKKIKNLVVDPVILSKKGYPLLSPDGIQAVQSDLISLARLVTPNIDEAEILSGVKIKSIADAEKAARTIFSMGCQAVLIKGGHWRQHRGLDLLYDGHTMTPFQGEYIPSRHTHGTGCVYSAAIAANLAMGRTLLDAVEKSKYYITEAIRHGISIGHGIGPIDPSYTLRRSLLNDIVTGMSSKK